MAFFEELGRKAKDVAAVAADKAKDVAAVAADKARETTELTKLAVAIAGEHGELEKNYRLIGEWSLKSMTVSAGGRKRAGRSGGGLQGQDRGGWRSRRPLLRASPPWRRRGP